MIHIVNVATGRYGRGQTRLANALRGRFMHGIHLWQNIPQMCRTHEECNYAFKARALDLVARDNPKGILIWLDASIVPCRTLAPVVDQIKRQGVWLPQNSFAPFGNYYWTADAAYPYLFPEWTKERACIENQAIDHCATTAFGVDLGNPVGLDFLAGFIDLGMSTPAFHGPWINAACPEEMERHGNPKVDGWRVGVCGPEDVRGHRHDQTAASVLAWRLGIKLDESGLMRYKGRESTDTVLIADGDY